MKKLRSYVHASSRGVSIHENVRFSTVLVITCYNILFYAAEHARYCSYILECEQKELCMGVGGTTSSEDTRSIASPHGDKR